MSERSGFFNAILSEGVYDRKYNANDYSENMAVVISNGVLRSTGDDLKVTATGLILTVATGRAWITGHWYHNNAAMALSAIVAPTGGARIDRVILRLDKSLNERQVHIVYLQGTAANTPVAPAITRNDTIYDLVLADIRIEANATTVTVTDQRSNSSLCGWVYSTSGDNSFFTSLDNSFHEWFQDVRNELSSVTLFKRYNWRTVLNAATNTVAFNIPQYDADTCFIEVFVNGILETLTTDYTLANTVLTFSGTLTAGTEVEVKCYKSIDGTGIMDVSDEITELQNQYATLNGVSKYTYKCTGANDNISLSEIAQALHTGSYVAANVTAAANAFLTALGGNTFLAAMSPEAQITIDVVGRLGATTPVAGAGTTESRYRWFGLGVAAATDKRIKFDFSKCEKITINCSANTNNIIFYGTDLYITGANVYAYSNSSGVTITMADGSYDYGYIHFKHCRLNISTSGTAIIAENGTFINCWCRCISRASHALCFTPKSNGLIRLIGGTYYAYIATSGMTAAICYTYSTETNAVLIAQNINCPTVAMTGFSQQYLAVGYGGSTLIQGVVSTMTTLGNALNISGQIWRSKR